MNSPKLRAIRLRGPRVAAILCVHAALILMVGAAPSSNFERNRRRIEEMSAVDRARLERNLHTFLDMPEDKRLEFRRLHQEIEEDTRSGGELRKVLENYSAWLATLTPYQRQEIFNEKDPVARAQLVRKIRQEKPKPPAPPAGRRPGPFARLPGGGNFPGRFVNAGQFSRQDFDAIVNVLEQELHPTPEQQTAWRALPAPERHVKVLKETLLGAPPEVGRGRRNSWPDEALMQKMFAAISDEPLRKGLIGMPDPQRRRQALGILVAHTLFAEWRPELERLRPSEEDLWELFQQVDPAERDELLRLPPEELQQRLSWQTLAKEKQELRDLFLIVKRLTPRPERPPMRRDELRPPDDRRGPRGQGPGPDDDPRRENLGRRPPEGPPPKGLPRKF